jgi:hypothetical protein
MATQDDLAGLIELRNLLLDTSQLAVALTAVQAYSEHAKHMLGTSELYQAKAVDYGHQVDCMIDTLAKTANQCTQLADQIQQDIDHVTQPLLSQEHFDRHLQIGYAARKSWAVPQETMVELVAEFNQPDVWKYPVACINAQHTGVLDILLPAKLIYLVDADQEYLDGAYAAEHAQVQARVKKHKLQSWNELDFASNITRVRQNLRWGLPTAQMSHVFCWNLFERYTYHVAVKNLAVIKTILRPGGKVIFGVNNADSVIGAQAATSNTSSYMTHDMVMKLLHEVQLELVSYRRVIGDNVCMVVAKASGDLHSLITHPARGLVKKS